MKILIIDGDYLQYEWLQEVLEKAFPSCQTQVCKTEAEFRQILPDLVKSPPDIVTTESLLRWQNPGDVPIKQDDEVRQEGFWFAGFRCQSRISKQLPNLPVIIYTIYEKLDVQHELHGIPENVRYVRKYFDPTVLLNTIVELVRSCEPETREISLDDLREAAQTHLVRLPLQDLIVQATVGTDEKGFLLPPVLMNLRMFFRVAIKRASEPQVVEKLHQMLGFLYGWPKYAAAASSST